MSLSITPFYAGVMALFIVVLSVRVISFRRKFSIALGDGGNSLLMRRIRAHANFAEYVPMALLLMALAELQGARVWAIHVIGLMLLVGRLVHASNISRESEKIPTRAIGMAFTLTALIIAALINIGLAGRAFFGQAY